jgi:hypothetical protein
VLKEQAEALASEKLSVKASEFIPQRAKSGSPGEHKILLERRLNPAFMAASA